MPLRVGELDYEVFALHVVPGVEGRRVREEEPSREFAFVPARVLLQDFTGVPALVDLAAMRDAMAELGGNPARVDPLLPS